MESLPVSKAADKDFHECNESKHTNGNITSDGCDTVNKQPVSNQLAYATALNCFSNCGSKNNEPPVPTPEMEANATEPHDTVKTTAKEGQVVLNNKTSASLSNLLVYESDDTSSSSESSDEGDVIVTRKSSAISIDSSSSSSDENEDVYVSDSLSEEELELRPEPALPAAGCKKKEPRTPKTKGELSVDELPPVPDLSTLNLNVPEEECIVMGSISGIVDQFVIVDSLPNVPPLDLDTLLFLSSGARPLGRIFDVMGPVSSPLYVVRFNKGDDIKSHNIHEGMPVYSAPNSEYTQFVFLKQLMQMKGSDASWVDDNEVPTEFVDFSDDEQESRHRSGCKSGRKRGSLERHRSFEREMNTRNTVDSAKRVWTRGASEQQQQPRKDDARGLKMRTFARNRNCVDKQKMEFRSYVQPAPPPVPDIYRAPNVPWFPPLPLQAFPDVPFYAPNVPPPCVDYASAIPPFFYAVPPPPPRTLPVGVSAVPRVSLPAATVQLTSGLPPLPRGDVGVPGCSEEVTSAEAKISL